PPESQLEGALDFALLSDGKILVLGGVKSWLQIALVRFLPDGPRDNGFGAKGELVLSQPVGGLTVMAVQPDDKVVLASPAYPPWDRGGRLQLSRLNASGSPDSSFGSGGIMLDPPVPSTFANIVPR